MLLRTAGCWDFLLTARRGLVVRSRMPRLSMADNLLERVSDQHAGVFGGGESTGLLALKDLAVQD